MANTEQPGPTPEMKGERDWSYGLFSCFDDTGTCCYGFLCPCLLYGKNKSRLEHLDRNGTPHPSGGESVGTDCCLYGTLCACVGFHWVLEMMVRGAVRTRYHIEGGTAGDCLAAWWCSPCDLTQTSREITLEEQSFGEKAA